MRNPAACIIVRMLGLAFTLRRLQQEVDAGAQGGERVAQVMPEHGDELLPQLGKVPLPAQRVLRGITGLEQLPLIPAAIGGLQKSDARVSRAPSASRVLDRVGDH